MLCPIPSGILEAAGLGWEGAVGSGWGVFGAQWVEDTVLGMIQISGQPLVSQSQLSQWKEGVGITPG